MTDPQTPATDVTPEPAARASQPEAVVGLATDGAYTLVAGQFPTLEQAEAVYDHLIEIERTTSLRLDGVIIASADAEGRIRLHEATDHSTKTGLRWGVVGGVVAGIIFPPTILAGAVGMGVVGAVLGKVRNLAHRSELSDELVGVLAPNTSGIIALVEDTAVVEIQKALVEADRIVSKAVDKQVAAEIDREARAAKEALAS
jgi:uncharacterized membrane protein